MCVTIVYGRRRKVLRGGFILGPFFPLFFHGQIMVYPNSSTKRNGITSSAPVGNRACGYTRAGLTPGDRKNLTGAGRPRFPLRTATVTTPQRAGGLGQGVKKQ